MGDVPRADIRHHAPAPPAPRRRAARARGPPAPRRRRRRTDARPGALGPPAARPLWSAGAAERLQSARVCGSRLSTEAPDRGPRTGPSTPGGGAPAPTHRAYTRDTTVHARRTTQHHSRSTRHLQQDARDTATVTMVSPDERQSEADSARRPGSDICELRTHATCA